MSCQLTEGFIKGLKSRETQDRGATNFEDEACLQVSSAAAAGSSSIVALYTLCLTLSKRSFSFLNQLARTNTPSPGRLYQYDVARPEDGVEIIRRAALLHSYC